MVNIRGKSGKQFSVTVFIFWGSKITADGDCSHEIKSDLLFGRKVMTNLQFMKRQGCNFADKCPYSQSYGFSSSHVRTWEFDHKEGWALKNSCFPTVVLEKTLESPLDFKEIKIVNSKRNQPWIFIGRTDAEAEVPKLWPLDEKNWLIGKDPDARKDWRQEKGAAEDEMVGCPHWLNGHEFGQTPGDGGGQVSLVCCSPWGRKESDTT